jgi:pimeloyl-ACP methyl ester carboxylesterase
MPYFTYNGYSCYYEEKGEGRPLLLLHGNSASSTMFYEIADQFALHYKVILIDFLGHGQSDRVEQFPADLWYDEARQVIAFLKQKNYKDVLLIGSSGGALAAINVALEAPELIDKVVADSFEGEVPLKEFTENVIKDREASKQDKDARMFYEYMHGSDWEGVVDNDTDAIVAHAKTIGYFFHKPLNTLKAKILMIGSKEDEFTSAVGKDFFAETYGGMIKKIGHGRYHIFEKGRHPACLSNRDEFFNISHKFFCSEA